MKKRIFSLLLCIVMCLSLFPMNAFAEATPAEMAFRFQVTVNGNEPSDEEFGKFTFYFDELKRPGTSNPWENLKTVMNGSINGSGDINFRSLDYSYGDEGTHWYRFYEDQEKIKDYTLDQTAFYLKVVILEDGVGADTEFRIYETRAYKAPFGADVYDNAGVVDRDKLTAIALDDIVFANTYGDPADYSEVTDALNACKALKASDYTSDSWQVLQDAINGVVYDLDADHQAEVDAMAKTIVDAIDALEAAHTHDFTGAYKDNEDGTHSRKCTGCDEYDTAEAHSYTDGVCVCGAEDLETVKATATAELNAAIAAAKCGEAKDVLTQALNDLATAQTVAAVKGIAGNAKSMANQYDNDYSTRLVGYTSALDAELNKPTASESLKARIEKLKEDIANAPTISELDRLFLSNIADIQLEGLKDAAVSEINAAKTDANASIAEAAVTAIGSAQSEDEINTIKSKALADMKEADELAAAKKSAIDTINAYKSDVNASIANAAIADINKATTTTEVSNILNQAIPNLLAADKKVEFKGKITNELLPAAKCDEARAILNKALTDLDDAVTLDEVNTVFYNAQGQASGKDSEFTGMLAGYTNAFNSALTDVATDETKAFVSEMLKALDEATSIARINEIYNSNKDKISVCINRDKSVDDFNKYIDSDEYSDEMKAIAREAIEKLMQAESVSDVEKITKDYKLKLDVQEDKETMREVLASDEYSDEMKALAQNALDELDDVTTSQELTNLWDKYNPLMRLQLTKDDARKEVKELLPENASDAVKKIVNDACDEIQANDDPDQYADIIKAAAEAIKAQLQKEAELAPAKEAAIAEINDAKTDANASVAEEAVKAINDATSVDEVSTLKEQALADMAAADAAAELTAAKETAKKAILAEQGDDTSEAVAKAVEDALAAIEAATTVDEVNAAMEDGIAAIKDAKAGNVPPAPVTYTILNGANSVWTKGSTSGLVVRSDAPFAKFVGVKVDGKTIAATNYTAEEGSTIVTLKSAYLETLETGKHSIEIVSADGSASTSFTVKANSQPADPTDPQTGDSSMIYLWMLILVVSAAGLSVTTVYSRKRRNHK